MARAVLQHYGMATHFMWPEPLIQLNPVFSTCEYQVDVGPCTGKEKLNRPRCKVRAEAFLVTARIKNADPCVTLTVTSPAIHCPRGAVRVGW